MWSYDNLAKAGERGVKTYPVLHVPGRQQTHDRYDDTWNETMDIIAGPQKRQSLQQLLDMREFDAAKRKTLFNFGA